MDDAPKDSVLTVSQVVAYNLRRARLEEGWTQEQAASQLSPYLGAKWSKATYSAAERSLEKPERIRRFTADDLVAFATTFNRPVLYFFLPPLDWKTKLAKPVKAGAGRGALVLSQGRFLQSVFGSENGAASVIQQLSGLMAVFPEQWGEDARRAATLLSEGIPWARRQEAANEVESAIDSLNSATSLLTDLRDSLEPVPDELIHPAEPDSHPTG
jgi:hypothetical protein